MSYFRYILLASVCLGFFYSAYILLFKNRISFRHARIYLITSVLLSLLIPLTKFKIETGIKLPSNESRTVVVYDISEISPEMPILTEKPGLLERLISSDPALIIAGIYFIVSGFFLFRVVLMLSILGVKYIKSFKVHFKDCVLLYDHGFKHTISFFKWIYVQPGKTDNEDLYQIIAHEKVHVNQLHSFDKLIIELLTAVMWFNPFVWMIKNSIQLVHEYLADEGALKTGINRFRYQALLINQIAEESLIALSSSFNNSLIKKRIKMMTKSKIRSKSLLKLLGILPVATFLLLLMAIFNGVFTDDLQASTSDNFSFVSTASGKITESSSQPPDTIFKKTIIKKISKDNPNDTITEEREEIITGDDLNKERAIRHGRDRSHTIVIHDDGDEVRHEHNGERHHEREIRTENGPERREVRTRRSYSVDVVDGDAIVKEYEEDDDSIKHIEIVTRRGDVVKEIDRDNIVSIDVVKDDADKRVVIDVVKEIRHTDNQEVSGVLYLIDGEKFTDKEVMNNLNPDDIKSVNIIKGADVKKYTDRDFEGVIVITTKGGRKK